MSVSVDTAVKVCGQFVTGQISITWDTRQTAEQFIEIRTDGAIDDDPIEFTMEEFIEYVKSNTADVIQHYLEDGGQIELEKEIFILDAEGSEVEA